MTNAVHHPTMATSSPGRPDFVYSTPKRYPIITPHYPKMAELLGQNGPTAHHASTLHPVSYMSLVPDGDGREPSAGCPCGIIFAPCDW